MLQHKITRVTAALALAGFLAGSIPAFAESFVYRTAIPGLRAEAVTISTTPAAPVTFSFTLSESSPGTLDVRTRALAAGWDGSSPVQAVVAAGTMLGSSSTSAYAVTIQGSFPGGVQLVNNGTISGAGGAGGTQAKGVAPTSTAGGAGGPALYVGVAATVTNAGTLAGGGGGGGGGGTGATWMGGEGGGGQGYSGGAAGPSGDYVGNAGTATASGAGSPTKGSSAGGASASAGVVGGTGANGSSANGGGGGGGGGWGAAGGTGGSSQTTGAAGGAGGAAVVGNAYVTWTATGTRYGAIQ
jgi:hypothetical protein